MRRSFRDMGAVGPKRPQCLPRASRGGRAPARARIDKPLKYGACTLRDMYRCLLMRQMLGKILKQYERMRKVGAYIENYRSFGALFRDNLDEFDDARYARVRISCALNIQGRCPLRGGRVHCECAH